VGARAAGAGSAKGVGGLACRRSVGLDGEGLEVRVVQLLSAWCLVLGAWCLVLGAWFPGGCCVGLGWAGLGCLRYP
jgi:hypothetical protein